LAAASWRPPNQFRNVREPSCELERSLLPTAANEDLRAAGPDRPGPVEGPIDSVVGTLEARALLGEHRPSDRQRFLEAVLAPADRRKLEAVARVLRLVPGRADPEHRTSPRDDVERRDDLGEHRRIAVRDAGDERPEQDALRLAASAPSVV